jgi:hypothetical protein
MVSNTNRHALVENARRVAAEYVAAEVSMANITAMLDGYLPAELVSMLGANDADRVEGQSLYFAAVVEEAKRLRKTGKSAK